MNSANLRGLLNLGNNIYRIKQNKHESEFIRKYDEQITKCFCLKLVYTMTGILEGKFRI